MPYTVRPSADGEEYVFLNGSTQVATLLPISNNELFLKIAGGGKWFADSPPGLADILSKGEIPEDYVANMLRDATPACFCDACPPKKSDKCEYRKAAS